MIKLVQPQGRYQGRYLGADHWTWFVCLDAENPHQLELVDKVTYQLHASLGEPVRTVSDFGSHFGIIGRSTGVFDVKATVFMKAGAPLRLVHKLKLFYPAHLKTVVYDE